MVSRCAGSVLDSDDNKAGYRQRDIITNQVGCTLTLGAVVDFRYAIKPQSHYTRPRIAPLYVCTSLFPTKKKKKLYAFKNVFLFDMDRERRNASVRFRLLLNKN